MFLHAREAKTLEKAGKLTSDSILDVDAILSYCSCCVWFCSMLLRRNSDYRFVLFSKRWSYQVGQLQFASPSLMFLAFVDLLAPHLLPVTRYKVLLDMFVSSSAVILGSIPEQVDNVFQG